MRLFSSLAVMMCLIYNRNAFAASSVYKKVLMNGSYAFFSVTIISAPCLRSVKTLMVLAFSVGHLRLLL